MSRILVVDDEEKIRAVIREYCEFNKYEVTEAADGMEAVELCRAQDFDAVILDIMLPKLDGFSACRQIREEKDIPVIMLSARGEEYDKLFGFELGIEDYIVKPFSPMELMARLKVALRRHEAPEKNVRSAPETYTAGGLSVDLTRRTVTIDGNPVMLAPKDMDLLLYLIRNRNRLLSREKILRDVWGYDFIGNGRIVDTHIRTIRNCLGSYRDCLTTHRNMGYRFEGPDGA